MLFTIPLPAVIVGLASLQAAAAAPHAEARAVPTVIPGPGLPSLESLGLTSEYLYSLPKPEGDPCMYPKTVHLGIQNLTEARHWERRAEGVV
jgi:hypothetical protein